MCLSAQMVLHCLRSARHWVIVGVFQIKDKADQVLQMAAFSKSNANDVINNA